MFTEGARIYTQVATDRAANVKGKLEIPATLILDLNKSAPRVTQHQQHIHAFSEEATSVTFSKEAQQAANGPVSRMNRLGEPSAKEVKQPTHEIVRDENGLTRMVVTFYGSDGQAVLTIPPKDSLISKITAITSHGHAYAEMDADHSYHQLNEAA